MKGMRATKEERCIQGLSHLFRGRWRPKARWK